MKHEIHIPPVGESVREVTIGRFLKQTGEFVMENDEIIELETEKVNQVIYSPAKGILSWKVTEGQTALIDEIIGHIDTQVHQEASGEPPKKAIEEPQKPKMEKSSPEKTKEDKEIISRIKTSATGKKETRVKMSKLRQVISRRLVESLRSSAMLTTFNEVDMSSVIDLRTRFKDEFLKTHGIKLGMTSFFVKATIEALKAFPLINSYIEGDEIVRREYFDIGVAVSTDRGLVVPVLRDCDQLSFSEIEKGIETFAIKAREGKLQIGDLEGGGFTISNGGVFGSLLSTPILNPPQVGILGMHKTEKRAVVVDDQIVIRPMMYLALSYDHRIIDGKEAIQFLNKIKDTLESFKKLE